MAEWAELCPRQWTPLALRFNPRAAAHSSTLSSNADQSPLNAIGWTGADILSAMESCPAIRGKGDPTEGFGLLPPYHEVDEIPSLLSPSALWSAKSGHRPDDAILRSEDLSDCRRFDNDTVLPLEVGVVRGIPKTVVLNRSSRIPQSYRVFV